VWSTLLFFFPVLNYSAASFELQGKQQKQKRRMGTMMMISRKGHQQKPESEEKAVAMISPPHGDGFRNSSSTTPKR